jgi:hypothetical protein
MGRLDEVKQLFTGIDGCPEALPAILVGVR